MSSLGRRAALARHGAQGFRYAVAGGGVQLLYLGVMALGVMAGWAYGWAMVVAQGAAIAVAFPLQRHFVFGSAGSLWGDFVRFLSVWSGGAVLGIAGTVLLVEIAGWHPVLAQGAVIVGAAIVVYLAQARFTFRWRRESS